MQANSSVDIESLLVLVPIFNGLAPEELSRIARGTREIHAVKGDILFNKGDACTGFHLLVSGQVKLGFTSAQGNEKVVAILGRGESFGEAIMFSEKRYIVFAQGLTDCLILHVSKNVIFDEMERDPNLCHKMLAGMAMRLHQLISDVESYSLQSGKQRIIGYFLRELPEDGDNLDSFSLTLSTNKSVIASRLNLTQEHFSRILHELSDLGLIVVNGRKITIPNVRHLRNHEG